MWSQEDSKAIVAKYPNSQSFVMRGMEPDTINTYVCLQCSAAGIRHVVYKDAPAKNGGYMRVCSGCQHEDGPWIPADQSPYYGY